MDAIEYFLMNSLINSINFVSEYLDGPFVRKRKHGVFVENKRTRPVNEESLQKIAFAVSDNSLQLFENCWSRPSIAR